MYKWASYILKVWQLDCSVNQVQKGFSHQRFYNTRKAIFTVDIIIIMVKGKIRWPSILYNIKIRHFYADIGHSIVNKNDLNWYMPNHALAKLWI